MKTNVTFRHFKSQHPALHNLAIEAAENFEKFYDGIISADIEFINDANKTVEFKVNVHKNTLIARESSDEFKKSLSEAADKMIRQIKKWKTKHKRG